MRSTSLVAGITLLGCAEIGSLPPTTEDVPVKIVRTQVRAKGAVAEAAHDGTTLKLQVSHACNIREDDVVSRTTTTEHYNKTPMVDLVLWNAGATTPVIVDIARANETTTKMTTETVPGDVVRRGVKCDHAPYARTLVTGRWASRDGSRRVEVDLGKTDAKGQLDVDLDATIPADEILSPGVKMTVVVGTREVGRVNLKSVYAAREARAWSSADAPSCESKVDARSCDGVAAFRRAYPDGPHAGRADALLGASVGADGGVR
jgi:hypothetical protein